VKLLRPKLLVRPVANVRTVQPVDAEIVEIAVAVEIVAEIANVEAAWVAAVDVLAANQGSFLSSATC
jgi:hypothetical protein